MRNRFFLFLCSTALLSACSSDTKEDEKTNEALWPQCEETRRVVGLDDETPFGITPRQAFEGAQGEYTAELTWEGGGTTELTLAFTTELAEVELVERKPNQGGGEGTTLAIAMDCNDSLEAKLGATFTSADGAFDESWSDLRLESFQIMGHPRLRGFRSIDLDGLGGSYTPNELPPADYDRILQANIRFEINEEGAFSGTFGYVAEKQHGDGPEGSVSAQLVTAATWK